MANSSAAQPTQRAKVYQFPDLRTATAPGDLSMLLERLTTVERQQEEMRLRQTSTALTTVLTNLVHNAFLFEYGNLSNLDMVDVSIVVSPRSVNVSNLKHFYTATATRGPSLVVNARDEEEEPTTNSVDKNVELNEAISDGVPLSRLLSVVAVVLSAFSIASLATWLIGNIPLIHPVMSLMSLVAAPFIYLMGRATQSARR